MVKFSDNAFTKIFSIATVSATVAMLVSMQSCSNSDRATAPAIINRDSLPILKSIGVSTLISDSGIIRYKIISEDWFIYDKKKPPYWSFEKGMFIEKFDENYHVEAFISADTAYYFETKKLWELRGRVFVKNIKGETFKTSLLYWDQAKHEIYSDRYMEIQGETVLKGYDFRSNEQMTNYSIHNSVGTFPINEEKQTPVPDPEKMEEYADTTQNVNKSNNKKS